MELHKTIMDAVTVIQAAEIYGCSRNNIYKHIRKGNLHTYKYFNTTVLKRTEVEELAQFLLMKHQHRSTQK